MHGALNKPGNSTIIIIIIIIIIITITIIIIAERISARLIIRDLFS